MAFHGMLSGILVNTIIAVIANSSPNCIFTAVYLCGYLYSLMGMKLQNASVASTMIQILKTKSNALRFNLILLMKKPEGTGHSSTSKTDLGIS